eukprot:tig00000455_g995.t1
MKNHVRVLVVGDEGTGKTSIINSLVSERFQEELPKVMQPVKITENGGEKVTITIVDSASGNEAELEEEMKKSNVVIVVYAVDNDATLASVRERWMPMIRKLGLGVPVVLTGNKIDVRGDEMRNGELENQIMPLMNEFSEIETCIECSAKQVFNIAEVFYFAQKAVLHPIAPIYDIREHKLRPECERALQRIFAMCDRDRDGCLNDDELNAFQLHCFGQPLRTEEVKGVKDVVRANTADGVSDSNGLTVTGFCYLHTLFIHKGRVETTWTILRKFGYDDQLRLTRDPAITEMKRGKEQVLELSEAGIAFLTEVFERFDKDKDGLLSEQELADLWSWTPKNPWGSLAEVGEVVETDAKGRLTLDGFLCRWTLWLNAPAEMGGSLAGNPSEALHYIQHLAFPENPRECVRVVRGGRRKGDARRGRRAPRTVFNCFVLGVEQTGKSSFINALIARPYKPAHVPTKQRKIACQMTTVTDVTDEEVRVTIIMHEFPFSEREGLLASEEMNVADLACICFHDSASFQRAVDMSEKLPPRVPRIFVQTKRDAMLDKIVLPSGEDPLTFCKRADLPAPVDIAVSQGDLGDPHIFPMMCETALQPSVACPHGAYETVGEGGIGKPLVVAGAAALSAYLFYRFYHSRRQ